MTDFAHPARWPTPIPSESVAGRLVRLEPLTLAHSDDMQRAGQHEAIWTYTTSRAMTAEAMRLYIANLLRERDAGTALPFVVRHLVTGHVAGVTRLKNLSRANASALVGSWYSPAVWRTGVNIEAKLLLLSEAFDRLGCIRVEFHTDSQIERSRLSLLRLGATQEGILRSCQLTREGRRRDSVIFSILETEWPTIRQSLQERLQRWM